MGRDHSVTPPPLTHQPPSPPQRPVSVSPQAWGAPAGTAGRTLARPDNPLPKESAPRQESPRPSIRSGTPYRPTSRDVHAQSEPPDTENEPAPKFPRPPACESSSSRILPASADPASRECAPAPPAFRCRAAEKLRAAPPNPALPAPYPSPLPAHKH